MRESTRLALERVLPCVRICLLVLLCLVLPAEAQISHVGFTEAGPSKKAQTLVLDVPAGVVAGDFMIAMVVQDKSGIWVTPAGWTMLHTSDGTREPRTVVYYRMATASEPASYTWTSNKKEEATGGITAYRGVDALAPIQASAMQANAPAMVATAPSLTTTFANAMLVAVWGVEAGVLNEPGGMTETVGVTGGKGGGAINLLSAYQPWAPIGATGTRAATISKNLRSNAALIALKPGGLRSFFIDPGTPTASTCAPKNISITARDYAGNTLTTYTGTLTLSTSTGRGDWAVVSGGGSLNNGAANDGAATYTFVAADRGVITLALTDRTPDAALVINGVDTTVPISSSFSPAIAFSDSAFVFSLDPVQVAGRGQAETVTLYSKDPATGICSVLTSYSGPKTLKAWVTRDALDPGGAAPTIGALVLPGAQPGANNLTLTFTAGVASFTLGTTDVGKYALNLRDDSSGFTNPALGTSNSITTRPFGLAITAIRQGGIANPGGTATAGASFIAAGDTFQTTVAGYLWSAADDANNDGVPDAGADITNNGVTPSYAWPTSLAVAAPYTPAAGTLGALGGSTAIAQASFAGGAATPTDLTYSEAGSVSLRADATGYLGTAGVNLTATSGAVGRFFAFQFALLPGASVSAGCGSFTYMDQARLGLSFTVEAQSKLGTRLTNYNSATYSFATATAAVQAEDTAAGNDGTDLSARVTGVPVPAPAWVAGRYTVSTTTAVFSRAAGPDGPYDALQLGVRISGDPNGAVLTGLNMNPATAGVCAGAGCTGVKLNATLASVRHGRLRLVNGVSSQLLPATLAVEAQYYLKSAGGFATNTLDNCTVLSSANFALGNGQGVAAAALQVNYGGGALSSGRRSFTVSKAGVSTAGPGGAAKSSVDVGLNLGVPAAGQYCSAGIGASTGPSLAHLRSRWCAAPGTWDRDPVARAAFGVYGGADTLLMLRENY